MNQIQAGETIWFIVQSRELVKLERGGMLVGANTRWLELLFVKTQQWADLSFVCLFYCLLLTRGLMLRSTCQVELPRSVPQGQLPSQVLGGILSLGTKRSRIPQSCFSLDFQFSGDGNDRVLRAFLRHWMLNISLARMVKHSEWSG